MGAGVTPGSLFPLANQEIFLLRLPALCRRGHPTRHASAARPGVRRVAWIAILNRNLATLAFAHTPVKELAHVEAVLLGHVGHFLLQRRALCALSFHLRAFDAYVTS